MNKRMALMILVFCLIGAGRDVSAARYTSDGEYDFSRMTATVTSGRTLYRDAGSWTAPVLKIRLANYADILESGESIEDYLSFYSTGSKIYTSVFTMSGDTIRLEVYGEGSGTLYMNVDYGQRVISLGNVTVRSLTISKTGIMKLSKKTVNLNVKSGKTNLDRKMKWTSSNKKVATVSKTGLVKTKKTGNALITAKIGSVKLGCVISVVPKSAYRAVNKAVKIAKTCKYSQAKRMRNGYYDCSSLVWKAYKSGGITFGDKSYAPTAASQAKYMVRQHKSFGSFTQKKVDKLKILPGDLCYKRSLKSNGRYKNIYHVEMVRLITCEGFDSSGKAVIEAYPVIYPFSTYSIMVRPWK